MDDRHFDNLAKLVGKGASRRSILQGFLGLGGAAVTGTIASDSTDARGGSVTRFQPPPPPATTPPPVCPPGQIECSPDTCCTPDQCLTDGTCCSGSENRCYNQDLCCPSGTCSRIGNADFCCPTDKHPCGLDCCASELQCCDNECCPATHTCLTRVFSPSAIVKEETCCPTELTCDNQCCDGDCYQPFGQTFIPLSYDRSCCPADPAFTFCLGTGDFAGQGLCCSGNSPDCCVRDGQPICINRQTQCCDDVNCPDSPATCEVGVCAQGSQICALRSGCEGNEECCPQRVGAEDVSVCIDPTQQCCNPTDCMEMNPGTDRRCWFCRPGLGFMCDPVDNGDPCRDGGDPGVCCDGACCNTGEICQEVESEVGIAQTAVCVAPTTTTGEPGATTTTTEPGSTTTTADPGGTTTTVGPTTTTQGPDTTTTGDPGTTTTANPCQNEGGTPCGGSCCRDKCCHNQSGDVCVGVDQTCCDADADCGSLNRCFQFNEPPSIHLGFACSGGGCMPTLTSCDDYGPCTISGCEEVTGCSYPPNTCDDFNPCTFDSCSQEDGCRNIPVPDGPASVGVCCSASACSPQQPGTCPRCSDFMCVAGPSCAPRPARCETAECFAGSCQFTDVCPGGAGSRGQGSVCEFGCQCNINLGVACSRDVGDTFFTCRSGGGGSGGVAPFCPPP